ncbi:hypothetical protein [Borreliella garinii]|nr:hypothetical protein [Borreliella garinii]
MLILVQIIIRLILTDIRSVGVGGGGGGEAVWLCCCAKGCQH